MHRVATIDDFAPVIAAAFPPEIQTIDGRPVLVTMDAKGRMQRLALTPFQFGELAGHVARLLVELQQKAPLV